MIKSEQLRWDSSAPTWDNPKGARPKVGRTHPRTLILDILRETGGATYGRLLDSFLERIPAYRAGYNPFDPQGQAMMETRLVDRWLQRLMRAGTIRRKPWRGAPHYYIPPGTKEAAL